MTESYIGYTKDGHAQSFVGAEAVDLFRAASLASMLRMLSKGLSFSNKYLTKTQALAEAGKYTKKKYKRGEYAQAADDLYALVRQRKGEIPAVVNEV